MEIPRLEEAYLRAARGLVKQSEATLMMKEIGGANAFYCTAKTS